ncbi:MAG: alpha/beta hydrolase [Anaerolineales bacterium]|nr:alpha/beta hydrolase [Anaerolineales bacterium]
MPTTPKAKLYYFAHKAEVEADGVKHPPVILIHGAGGTHISWPPQIRRMAEESIYAIDLPGHGKSEGNGRQSIDDYADDVIAFMKETRISAAVFVGISMGGAIALTLALKHPKQVLGVALLGTGSKLRVAPAILETAGGPASFESAVDMVNENCFSEGISPAILALSKKNMMQIRPPVFLGDFLACNEFDVTSQLENIKVPTLIVCGSQDKMTPLKYSELLQLTIPNSQLHVVENAGHMVMVEQPDATAEVLKNFIDGIPVKIKRATKKRVAPKEMPDPASTAESNPIDAP